MPSTSKSQHRLMSMVKAIQAGHHLEGLPEGVTKKVEQMASRGVEVVLGIKRDPAFGPVLMFGLGGISVELFKDVAFGLCPLSPEGAKELIGLTRAAALLRGFRGQPEGDEDALVDAMVRLSRFAAHHADRLAEMDVNPVIVLPKGQGVLALDAMIACDAPFLNMSEDAGVPTT